LRTLAPVIAGVGLALCAFGTCGFAAGKADDTPAAPAEGGEAGKQAGPAKKKSDPVEAQRAVDHASKLIEAGKTEQAIQVLSAALAAGNLPPAIMAKALLYRGIAYRQQKKPAQAISDFTSALWLKAGLSEADRAEGLRQRAAAYAEAGLGQAGEAAPAAAKETRSKERTASPAPWSDGTTTSAPPAHTAALNHEPSAPAAASGGWDLFANLFGGGTAASPVAVQPAPAAPRPEAAAPAAPRPEAAAPAAPRPEAAAPAAPRPDPATAAPRPDTAAILNAENSTAERSAPARRTQANGWSRQTQVESARAARVETAAISTKEEPPRRATVVPEPPTRSGNLRIQIAAVRTQAEAQALAAKVMREHAGTLAKREPQIDQTIMGNMGSFYRVLIGPFASAQETQSICAKLKGTGLDCLVTAQ
jgi:ribosomal protein S7